MKKYLVALIVCILFLAFWEFVSQHWIEYRYVLPPPSSIAHRLGENPALFLAHTSRTVAEMSGGFILALFAAFPIAWAMYVWKSSRFLLQPFFIILQSIPMFTLAPLMVFWFGWSIMAIVIPTALMIFLPLTLSIYQGLSSTPKSYLEFFRFYQATSWQTFSKLLLPWSLPYIFGGFRISASLAGISAIAGEWAGAQSGLGVLMLKSRRETDLATTFAALFCISLISIIFYGAVSYLESRFKNRQPFKRLSLGAVIGLLMLFGFVPFPRDNPQENKLRVLLDWLPNSNHVPIYAGIERKIFEKHHIHLQVLEIHDPSDTIPYLTSGQTELALFYMPDVVKANMKGANLKVLGVLVDKPLNSFIFRKNAQIIKPQDLNDKVIGYCLDGGNFASLERLLKDNRIIPKELKNVNFDLVTLLGLEHVDAVYGAFWNIEGEHLKSLNIDVSHFDVSELGHPTYSELVFIGALSQEQIVAFQEAMQESIDFCRNNPEEAFRLYTKSHPEKSLQTVNWEKKAWFEVLPYLAKSQQIAMEEWERLQHYFFNM